ncbi:MAG: transcription-repair coupling factor, partial [Bryobacteraceae bacterium]|nr:transcription-repair coupling factor [Bryobacteraceae bacterium]
MTHPAIRDLLQSLARQGAFQELIRRLLHDSQEAARMSLSGLTPTAKALYLVHLWHATERPQIVVVDGNKQAESLFETVETFFDLLTLSKDAARPQLLPAFDVLPHQGLSPHSGIGEQRAVGLWRLAAQKIPITIAPVASAMFRVDSGDAYRQLALHLRVNDEIPLESLTQHFESIGYERRDPVEMVGEYSVRGGIVDVFPPEASKPLRLEFFGDTLESLRRFDAESQRSVLKLDQAWVLPLAEFQRPRAIAEQAPGWEFRRALEHPRRGSLLDLVKKPLLILDEPEQTKAAAERWWKRMEEDSELA